MSLQWGDGVKGRLRKFWPVLLGWAAILVFLWLWGKGTGY